MEHWEHLSGASNKYAISSLGRVWSANIGIMKTPINNFGYPHLNVMNNNKMVRIMCHVSVAKAFIPNPKNKPTVNHKNGIRHDNRVDNLEWATSREQNIHSVQVLGRKGAPNYNRRKSVIAYREGMSIIIEENGVRAMGRRLGIPYQAVQTGIKKPIRTYFGWKFECVYDPKWKPKLNS